MPTRKLDELTQELMAERAAALGRTAARLEAYLTEVARLDRELESATTARDQLLEERARARDQAVRQRWYLIVQREAIGLYDHRILDELYPLPGRPR